MNYDNIKSTFKLSLDDDVIGQDVPLLAIGYLT